MFGSDFEIKLRSLYDLISIAYKRPPNLQSAGLQLAHSLKICLTPAIDSDVRVDYGIDS